MLKKVVIAVCFLLSACGSEQQSISKDTTESVSDGTPELIHTATGDLGSWYELGDYGNGIPGYSGGFATYTAHHTPMAVNHEGDVYFTFSDNTSGQLKIYLKRNDEPAVLVDQIATVDPHQNPALNIDSDGFVHLVISARGARRPSLYYKSVSPESLTLRKVSESNYAYPQLWPSQHGLTVLYNEYKSVPGSNLSYRSVRVKNDSCDKELVAGGHYQVSYQSNGKLFSFYNWTPDGNVTKRQNLYLIQSEDGGCSWKNYAGDKLSLPLSEDSDASRIYNSGGKKIFPTDAFVIEGKPAVLFIEAETASPKHGPYELFLWYDGVKEKVTEVGHQYNTGYMFARDGKLFVVTPTFGKPAYAGGDVALYERNATEWNLLDTIEDGGNYNYIRRVYHGDGAAIMTEAASDKESPALLYRLQVK